MNSERVNSHVRRVVRALAKYLVIRPWAVWAGVAAPVLLVLFADNVPAGLGISDDERNVIVALLEISGLVLIALGYAGLRSEFGRPSMKQAVRTYLSEFKLALRAPRTTELKASSIGSIAIAGSARLTMKPGPDAPLERRVEILEGALTSLTDDVGKLTTTVSRDHTALGQQLEQERQTREKGLREVRGLLETASIGSPGTEVLGWLWLLAGIIVSAAPSAIALLR